jgi:alkylation response protein AidB-like acyl-CoA dehydrogenase
MDLELTSEQRLLREAAERFGREGYERKRSAAEPVRWSRAVCREMAALGWFAIGVPEADGGIGCGPLEIGIVAEALGRALVLEPFLDTTLAARLVARLGDAAQRARYLPGWLDGSRQPALATAEGTGFGLERLKTAATPVGDGWVLSGQKDFVSAGADEILVTARIGDAAYGVFVLEPGAAGVETQRFETVDGREACRLVLRGAAAARLGDADAKPVLAEALDLAAAMLAAEAVGCMDALLAATVDYTKTREQFGKPLAANQVLRHRMADMSVCCEEARAIALRAQLALEGAEAARAKAVSAAKYKIGHAGRFVAESAIQLHGGMGVTEELDIGLFAKRLLAIEVSFGTSDQHLRRHAELSGAAAWT